MDDIKTRIEEMQKSLMTLLSADELTFDDSLRTRLPNKPGIYRILKKRSDWSASVYLGKTGDLRQRVFSEHFRGNSGASTLTRKMIARGDFAGEENVHEFLAEKCSVQFLEIQDDRERTAAEHFAIATLRPAHND
jgi:hypothetical protein